jgi:hypothetical protein
VASDVVSWLHDALDDNDARARAEAAQANEAARKSQRKTVTDAVARILG